MLKPKLRLTKAEKEADNFQAVKDIALWYRDNATPILDEKTAKILYRAANDEMEEDDYYYVTNPLNTNRKELQGYPSKLRNFGIIKEVVMLLAAEKTRRGVNKLVFAINSDMETEREKQEKDELVYHFSQRFVNKLIQQGVAPEDVATIPKPYDIIKRETKTLKDQLAESGQEGLDYVYSVSDVERKFLWAFIHFLITDMVITYKDIFRNEITYEPVSPVEMSIVKDDYTTYLEDAEATVRTFKLPVNTVIDLMQDKEGFDKEIIDSLESGVETPDTTSNYNNIVSSMGAKLLANIGWEQAFYDENGVVIDHVNFTILTKSGKLETFDEFGMPITVEVDENYVPLPSETIKWEWVKEKQEAYILNNDTVVGCRPISFQRGTVDNPSKAKNLYNGMLFSMPHTMPNSIVASGIPYQEKYNIGHYIMEKILGKHKDKIIVMPKSLLPEDEGEEDTDHMLHYAEAHGFIFPDDSNRDAVTALQNLKVLDLGLGKFITEMKVYLDIVKAEWENKIGITRQRRGETFASDGKAVNEQAIYRGAMMSELRFREFDYFQEKELNGLMELSQIAYSDGFIGQYVTSDFQRKTISINPEKYCLTPYGVKVSNSARDLENTEAIKSRSLDFIQNNAKHSMVAKLLVASNYSQINSIIEETEKELEERMQEKERMDREAIVKAEEIKKQVADNELQYKYYKTDVDNMTVRLNNIEKLNFDIQKLESTSGETKDTDKLSQLYMEREKNLLSLRQHLDNVSLKREEIASKERIENKKADAQKFVAKVNT